MLKPTWFEKEPVFRFIVLRLLLDPSRTEGILQGAFIHVLASGKAFPSEADAYRYMRRVVFNKAIDYYRAVERALDSLSTVTVFVYSEPPSTQPKPPIYLAERRVGEVEIQIPR